jgi:predicted MFS family arabinose efflux permease
VNLREVPRLVWVLAASRFLSSATSFTMLFLTLYLTGPRGLAVPVAGIVSGEVGVGLLVGNFTGGRWGDRFGHRRIVLSGSLVTGAGTVAIPWLPVPVLVGWLPVLAYLGATVGVSVGALSALAVDRGDRRTSVAIGRAASNAGFVIGPPLAAVIVAHSYGALFVIEGLMSLAVRLLVAPAMPREPERGDAGDGPHGLWRAVRADRALMLLLPAVVLADLVYRQLYTTVPLHLRGAGEPVSLYTSLNAIGSGLILLLEIPVAQRLRRQASYPIIATGYLLLGAGFALFGLPVSAATAILAMVVLTGGEILYKTTATAHVLDAAPDHLVGQYQGLYTGAATSGTMLAGPVGTAVYAAAPTLLWPLCGGAGIVAAATVIAASRVSRRSPGGSPP